MAEKVVKKVSSKEAKDKYMERLCNMFHNFLSEDCDLWPELKSWDYKKIYGMNPIAFNNKYSPDKKYTIYAAEALFKNAAMLCAPRDDLVRIMMWYLIILDFHKYCLDIFKAKADLGINDLFKKYLMAN